MLGRLVNLFGALVMGGLWFVICTVAVGVLFGPAAGNRATTILIFVATLGLAAWRTRNASLNDNAEEHVAKAIERTRQLNPANRLNPMRDSKGEVMALQLALVVLTMIPAIAIGMLMRVFTSDDE